MTSDPFPPVFGFRRRCAWCGVQLRAWQVNTCKGCRGAILSQASSPCPHGSRWDAPPDGLEHLAFPSGSVGS